MPELAGWLCINECTQETGADAETGQGYSEYRLDDTDMSISEILASYAMQRECREASVCHSLRPAIENPWRACY